MSSVVPYDPDDFDNNPFADDSSEITSSLISQPISAEQVSQNPDGTGNLDRHLTDTYNPSNTTDAGNISGNTNSNTSPSTATTEVSEFNDYPTEMDLKKYLPERYHQGKFRLIIRIQEIESNGDQVKNPIFKFNAKIHKLGGFKKETYRNVRRTYKELESFYKYLMINNVEVFVPAIPTITTLYTPMTPEYIMSVTTTFQDWFNRICANPILIKNKEFALLFEQNDFSYVPSKTKPSSNSVIATGLKRKTLKQFQPPYDSCEYLARYRPLIKEIHLSCQKLLEKLERALKYQRQYAYYNNEFITLMGELSEIEPSEEMAKLWRKFHKFSSMFNEVDLIKNASLASELLRFFRQISDDTYNIKEALTNRHLLIRELLNAEEATKRKHAVITKIKMKTRIDPIQVDEAIRALEQSNVHEKELRYQVKRTTYEMLIEAKEYLEYMESSTKKLFKIIAKQQILQERKKLNKLVSNRLINHQDSLGRLGREDLPDLPHVASSSDQDSWSSRTKKNYDNDSSNNVDQTTKVDLSDELSNVDAKSAAFLLAGSSF
ncbi:hypothetical protein CANINC_002921 [Pichia inconspicua]|uniref:PX domain-containing protein n=1 Tax=Pichia inconspicua TaxID=52247 RepID=A0A4T0WZZ9_9ASCO|nr:hypothetical protein CANINC_002921 [[Candida] inconspicua]